MSAAWQPHWPVLPALAQHTLLKSPSQYPANVPFHAAGTATAAHATLSCCAQACLRRLGPAGQQAAYAPLCIRRKSAQSLVRLRQLRAAQHARPLLHCAACVTAARSRQHTSPLSSQLVPVPRRQAPRRFCVNPALETREGPLRPPGGTEQRGSVTQGDKHYWCARSPLLPPAMLMAVGCSCERGRIGWGARHTESSHTD